MILSSFPGLRSEKVEHKPKVLLIWNHLWSTSLFSIFNKRQPEGSPKLPLIRVKIPHYKQRKYKTWPIPLKPSYSYDSYQNLDLPCTSNPNYKASPTTSPPKSIPTSVHNINRQVIYRVYLKFSDTWNELLVVSCYWLLVHLKFFLRKYQMKKSIIPTLSENFNEIKQTWHQLQPQMWSEVNV